MGHSFDQAGDVCPASHFVFLVLPEGDRRVAAAGAVDEPVATAEAWAHGYGGSVHLLEDRYALLHLLRPNLYAYHPCEQNTSPKETVSPSPGESMTLRLSTAMTPLLTAPGGCGGLRAAMMAARAVWRIPHEANFAEFILLILSKSLFGACRVALQIVKGCFSTHLSLRTQVEFTLGKLPNLFSDSFPTH